jgi:hypothetical protein
MNSSASGNAMTEVALALAMAFFSLMVLTMVSMGTPQPVQPTAANPAVGSQNMSVALAAGETAPADTPEPEPTLVVFWQGRFLDQNLQQVDVATRKFDGRVILALPPDVPMGEALAARARINAGNLVVSALNKAWLERLRKPSGKE